MRSGAQWCPALRQDTVKFREPIAHTKSTVPPGGGGGAFWYGQQDLNLHKRAVFLGMRGLLMRSGAQWCPALRQDTVRFREPIAHTKSTVPPRGRGGAVLFVCARQNLVFEPIFDNVSYYFNLLSLKIWIYLLWDKRNIVFIK